MDLEQKYAVPSNVFQGFCGRYERFLTYLKLFKPLFEVPLRGVDWSRLVSL